MEALSLTEDEQTIQIHLPGWDFTEYANPPEEQIDNTKEEFTFSDETRATKLPKMKYPVQNRFPIIIWWTPFTGHKHIVRQCGHGRCLFSHNRELKDHTKTRALMWYGTDLKFKDLPLPRQSKHDWALLHEESPKNNWPIVHKPIISLFNHTCTFRRESSYPITLQYLPSMEYLTAPLLFDVLEKNRFISEQGLAPVLYVQSDCDVPSDRDRYVKKLMEYIKVDSLGKCLHNKDLPDEYVDPLTMDKEGFHKIIAKYKFTVSFENAVCNDYITEKLWRTLSLGSLPIYMGSPSVQDWMPTTKALILANDYPTVEALANYIKFLDENDDEYEQYFDFKNPGKITNSLLKNTMKSRTWGVDDIEQENFIDGFECHVCDRVFEELLADAKRQKPPTFQANDSHYGCPRPQPAVPGMKMDNSLRSWVEEFDTRSAVIAKATQQMVKSGANSSRVLNDFIKKVFSEMKSNNFDHNHYENELVS